MFNYKSAFNNYMSRFLKSHKTKSWPSPLLYFELLGKHQLSTDITIHNNENNSKDNMSSGLIFMFLESGG